MADNEAANLADIADGALSGPEWDSWLAAHPRAAAEVETARRVRALLRQLEAASVPLPADFEARLMQRVREDSTLLNLLELLLSGLGHTLVELLDLLFGRQGAPTAQPAPES